jgi:acetyl esterase
MAGLLQRIQRAQTTPLHALGVDGARKAYAVAAEVLDLPRAPLPRVDKLQLPGGDGQPLCARLYASAPAGAGAVLPVLLYLHGGGFVIGGLETHDSLCRQLALRSGGAVLALDYRRAPEHPFPAAVEDSWAALRWLHGHALSLGLDPQRIAVGGDSAGGTLAAVTALWARGQGLPLALQLLITPGTAAHDHWPSRKLFGQGFLLDTTSIEWFFEHYAGPQHGGHRFDWRFAPLEAPDVDGVAPAHVLLAECDPLVDEGLAYADRLRAAGVAVSLDLVRGVTHDFIKMGRALNEAGAAQQAAADALKQAWWPE